MASKLFPFYAERQIKPLIAKAHADGINQRGGTLLTTGQIKSRARHYADKAWKRVEQTPGEINYVAATEMLAFSIYGCHLNELSDVEAENCRRHARSTINTALGINHEI